MFSAITRILMLSLALMFAGRLSAQQNKTVYLPENTAFTEEQTGVVFPAVIGSYTKSEVRKNPNPVMGTLIRFAGNRGGCTADVFVYTLSENPQKISPEDLRKHYGEVEKQIRNLPEKSEQTEAVENTGESEWVHDGQLRALHGVWQIRLAGESFQSEILLFPRGGYMVKLRITAPAESPDALRDMRQFTEQLCGLFFKEKPAFKTVSSPQKDGQPESEERKQL